MNYCSECGAKLVWKIPCGDNCERFVCESCDKIHYQNPVIIASCLAHFEDKVVWMQRAEQPRKGSWVIPAGFMEKGETLREAAARELFEETGAVVRPEQMMLHTLGNLMYTDEVYIVFRAPLMSETLACGSEALHAALFSEEQAPWDNIAYPVMEDYVRRFYRELAAKSFTIYIGEFRESGNWIQNIALGLD